MSIVELALFAGIGKVISIVAIWWGFFSIVGQSPFKKAITPNKKALKAFAYMSLIVLFSSSRHSIDLGNFLVMSALLIVLGGVFVYPIALVFYKRKAKEDEIMGKK
ncbi:hypothetical protein SPBRAN_260 [uncultured Candidatus Thioglobus sp.]|nr:hypothetical protein SPBRAN_260 [uncultured Candidatus Thioglobus sp.]